MILLSQAPTRIDLAGGTLDIWPLYLFHENSQTLNFAINCYARCWLTPRRDKIIEFISRDLHRREVFPTLEILWKVANSPQKLCLPLHARLVLAFATSRSLPLGKRGVGMTAMGKNAGFALETDSGVPAGSGLGGSSALNIAICGALSRFTGRRLPPPKLIEMARNVEAQVLRVPTGEQDYYSAVYGGIQAIRLTPEGVYSEKLAVNARELAARVVLCYTGQSRNSGINNWEVLKARVDGNRAVVRHFDRIAAIAAEMRQALENNDWRLTARLLNREWGARKKNYPGITTPQIEHLMALARRHGALATKACGAGGGGCIIFLVEPEAKAAVETALRQAGARVLPFRVAPRGLTVKETS